MLSFLKKLIYDESAFERYSRACLIAGSVAIATVGADGAVNWWAFAAAFLGGLIGAGEKNA